MKDFMGFYDIQLEALKALWEAVHDAVGIPYQTPLDSSGNTLKGVLLKQHDTLKSVLLMKP